MRLELCGRTGEQQPVQRPRPVFLQSLPVLRGQLGHPPRPAAPLQRLAAQRFGPPARGDTELTV